MGQYFVGVGGQKCGTSWLGNHLYRHPQVFSHSIKEMHVFDSLASEPERAYRTAQVQEILVELAAELARAEAAGEVTLRSAALERWVGQRRAQLAILQAPDDATAAQRYEAYFADRLQPAPHVLR